MDTVRVRFAPSPTGYLHIGGARTALYNWLFARRHHGTFVLRIEDTDVERSTRDSIDQILEGMRWLGLDWDEGPFFQSERIEQHRAAAAQLLAAGHAYKCFCTKEALEEKRRQALAGKQDARYDGTCRDLTPDEVRLREAQGLPFVVRFKTPRDPGSVIFDDAVYGRIEKRYEDIEDFVILRSDGNPLYLLSSAVDDKIDRITHVIRGQDGLGNTPRQILLYNALGEKPPIYAHMSLTLDTKKAKISKRRHGEVVTVGYYREHGFLPWALCNFLALLGWSTPDDREFFSREELIQNFSLEGIARHNSVFNYHPDETGTLTDPKALSMNARYLSMTPVEELIPRVRDVLEPAGLWDEAYAGAQRDWFTRTIELIRTRFHTLQDFATRGRPYFSDDFPFEDAAVRKNLKKDPDLAVYLPRVASALESLNPFNPETIEAALRAEAASFGVKPGLLINAVRTAVTGQSAGPGLFELLELIGRERTVARVRSATALL